MTRAIPKVIFALGKALKGKVRRFLFASALAPALLGGCSTLISVPGCLVLMGLISGRKNRPKDAVFGQEFLGHQGTTRWDIPDPGPGLSGIPTLCKAPYSAILDRKWPGCPAIWVGTFRDQRKFMQENSGPL